MSSSKSPDLELKERKTRKQEEEEEEPQTVEFNEDKYFGNTRIAKDDGRSDDPENIVVMKNVHKTYLLGIEGVPALRGVSLNIKRGEFVVIFGTSGGGKTTMLNILGTIDKPTKGELRLSDYTINQNTKDSDLSMLRLTKLGFVFQTFNLLSSLTAIENVEMPMILHGVLSPSERTQRAKELLEMVGLGKRVDHVPSQLSGGEQQRTTIARAIANNPEILLLDEPTGDLDTHNTHVVMKLLTELNRKGITMIMVTHDVALKNYADRIIWMRDGKIQRIEVVPKSRKVDAIRRTDDELAAFEKKKEGQVKVDREIPANEYRQPISYKTHAHFVKSVQKGNPSKVEVDKESKEEERLVDL